VKLIPQIPLPRTPRDESFDLLYFVNPSSFKPARIVEDESGVASKHHLIFDVMDSPLK
jgi:hypothetical protein